MKPQMNPTQGGPQFNPDQNPFESIMAQTKAMPTGTDPMGGMQLPPMGNPAQRSPMQPPIGGPGAQTPPGPMDALMPGKTGDTTKPLLGAIQALHAFIAASTEPQEINMIRQVVSLLSKLVSRDQEKSVAALQGGAGQGAPQAPASPTGPTA